MELGTVYCNEKIYNLNFMPIEELKNILEAHVKNEKYAILRRIYEYRITEQFINTKVNSQIAGVNYEINLVNRKFSPSSKNYFLVKEEIQKLSDEYRKILVKICYKYDSKIEQYIIKKLKYEEKLKRLSGEDAEKRPEIQNEINFIKKKIDELSEKKIKEVYNAMESDEKRLSTKISKPKNFSKITRFFANKFNTYNVIAKNILNPIRQRIDEYLSNNESIYDISEKPFNAEEFINKTMKIVKQKNKFT